jgi:exonuclease V gamma subunit
MKKVLPFLLLATLLTLHTGCASWKQNRWLAAHQKELKRLADSNLTPEQKLDGLVQDYIKFMNEDLKFINPVKGVKYVKKYHDQNRASMDKILKASEKWQGNLGTVDKISLGVRTLQKPYVKDLIDLVPKFKRKYKQYAFALELASKIGGGLTRFAGKDLF